MVFVRRHRERFFISREDGPSASGIEGGLMAVINENVSDAGVERWMELAYIRAASGREFTTSVANVQPA
ncbi:hypothetical protein ACFVRB_17095 [Streptomyces nojiriensis]|uniref:hypothetical protein n=1 Tax=Streptomyces nojiriensis TaxID=66374 RepID=UPI0036DF2EBE